jgi:hypothetical protein
VPIYLAVADGYLFSLTRRFTILSKPGDVVCAMQPPVPEFCCDKLFAGTRQTSAATSIGASTVTGSLLARREYCEPLHRPRFECQL